MSNQPTPDPNLFPTEQTLEQARRRSTFREDPYYQSWLDGKFVVEGADQADRDDMLVSVSARNRLKRNGMHSRRDLLAQGQYGFEHGYGLGDVTIEAAVSAVNNGNDYDEPLLERPNIFDVVSLGVDPKAIGFPDNTRINELSVLAKDIQLDGVEHRYTRFEAAYEMASKILDDTLRSA